MSGRRRAARTIRRVGQDERLLRRVLDALEDRRTRQEIGGRIDEMGERERTAIDAGRVAEELFGEPPATGSAPET